jgi:CheY-like chemotaxis protein
LAGVDGLGFARSLKGDPAVGAVKLVLLSPIARAATQGNWAEAGFAACLLKPVRQAELHECLGRIMRMEAGGAAAPGPRPSKEAAPSVARLAPAKSLRILVAEDNQLNRAVVMQQLDRLGYSADIAANGAQALQEVQTKTYDVVLMDWQMPEMDGLEVTRRIRQLEQELVRRNPDYRPVRIVALTASALPEDREKCFVAGMDDFVSKPVKLEALQEAMARCEAALAGGAEQKD